MIYAILAASLLCNLWLLLVRWMDRRDELALRCACGFKGRSARGLARHVGRCGRTPVVFEAPRKVAP